MSKQQNVPDDPMAQRRQQVETQHAAVIAALKTALNVAHLRVLSYEKDTTVSVGTSWKRKIRFRFHGSVLQLYNRLRSADRQRVLHSAASQYAALLTKKEHQMIVTDELKTALGVEHLTVSSEYFDDTTVTIGRECPKIKFTLPGTVTQIHDQLRSSNRQPVLASATRQYAALLADYEQSVTQHTTVIDALTTALDGAHLTVSSIGDTTVVSIGQFYEQKITFPLPGNVSQICDQLCGSNPQAVLDSATRQYTALLAEKDDQTRVITGLAAALDVERQCLKVSSKYSDDTTVTIGMAHSEIKFTLPGKVSEINAILLESDRETLLQLATRKYLAVLSITRPQCRLRVESSADTQLRNNALNYVGRSESHAENDETPAATHSLAM